MQRAEEKPRIKVKPFESPIAMKIYKISSDIKRLRNELERTGVDAYALNMDRKGYCLNLSVSDIKPAAANIIKQEAIASGMDAALKRGAVSCSVEKTDVLLMGTLNEYERLIKRLKRQPFGLKAMAAELELFIGDPGTKAKSLIARGVEIDLGRAKVMGILNVTPDSFSDGGLFYNGGEANARIDEMIVEGADIIDIGGMSSRPGSGGISSDEEIKRIKTPLEYAIGKGVVVSVDTCYHETARFALEKGAHIINDISGLRSPKMRKICAEYKAGVCIMHMPGSPADMQNNTYYDDLLKDIKDFFHSSISEALNAGIDEKSLIIDPGFGFGKTIEQNYTLLKYMNEFSSFDLPILAGLSRKSMIGAVTGQEPAERVTGTVALNAAALLNGASIIRVHDVAQGAQTVKVIDYLKQAKEK